jgi:hypothetical protein
MARFPRQRAGPHARSANDAQPAFGGAAKRGLGRVLWARVRCVMLRRSPEQIAESGAAVCALPRCAAVCARTRRSSSARSSSVITNAAQNHRIVDHTSRIDGDKLHPCTSAWPRLDSPATPRCDGRGHDRSLRNRRAARCHRFGHDGGFRNWCADDTDSSNTCSPDWHYQSPSVAVASSASMEAMIA